MVGATRKPNGPAAATIAANASAGSPATLSPRAAHSANAISIAGPTPIPTAPQRPPGILNGRGKFGSFTRSTTSATNSSSRATPYSTRSIEISRSNDTPSAGAHASEHSTTLTHGTPAAVFHVIAFGSNPSSANAYGIRV